MGIFNSTSIFKFTSKSDIIKIVLVVTILFVLLQFIRISMLINSNSDADFLYLSLEQAEHPFGYEIIC